MLDHDENSSVSWRWLIVSAVWLAVPVLGFAALNQYNATHGDVGAMSAQVSKYALPRRPRLLMFLHPKCPCSAASLTELAKIVARIDNAAATEIVFVVPEDVEPGWERTELYARAAAIPGVTVATDPGGIKAKEFGARTSGFAVLLGTDGRPLFRGGINRARGHEGESAGSRALLALLAGEPPAENTAPVYGCPLLNGA